jgi:hypothetical protein
MFLGRFRVENEARTLRIIAECASLVFVGARSALAVVEGGMNDPTTKPSDKKSATEILAALVAQRKAAGGQGGHAGREGGRENERAAAARSAAKSKPALRK